MATLCMFGYRLLCHHGIGHDSVLWVTQQVTHSLPQPFHDTINVIFDIVPGICDSTVLELGASSEAGPSVMSLVEHMKSFISTEATSIQGHLNKDAVAYLGDYLGANLTYVADVNGTLHAHVIIDECSTFVKLMSFLYYYFEIVNSYF